MTSTCVHCGERIVLVNYALGPSWVHQPAGASFADGRHQHCHLTVATPPATETMSGDAHA